MHCTPTQTHTKLPALSSRAKAGSAGTQQTSHTPHSVAMHLIKVKTCHEGQLFIKAVKRMLTTTATSQRRHAYVASHCSASTPISASRLLFCWCVGADHTIPTPWQCSPWGGLEARDQPLQSWQLLDSFLSLAQKGPEVSALSTHLPTLQLMAQG